jgi:tRNA A58 N-methylase Trm61
MHSNPMPRRFAQERRQAELDAQARRGAGVEARHDVADVGSGFGAMTVVLGHWIGSGRVFATDITEQRCGKRAST